MPKEITLRVPASCRPGEKHAKERSFSESVEEYIDGIYRLEQEVERVSTGEVAIYMMVSAGSATTMVKKMAEMGLVEHEPYQGIRLTEFGNKVARQLMRSHRLIERFLVDELELPWDDVHELACKLEHYLSEEVVDKIDRKLGFPTTCPHGNPVDVDAPDPSIRLEEAPVGRLRVSRISDERASFLRRLDEMGLRPGVEFEATGSTAIDQLIHLEVNGHRHTVGHEVSRHLWVVPA